MKHFVPFRLDDGMPLTAEIWGGKERWEVMDIHWPGRYCRTRRRMMYRPIPMNLYRRAEKMRLGRFPHVINDYFDDLAESQED
jgi:hypothetical protein